MSQAGQLPGARRAELRAALAVETARPAHAQIMALTDSVMARFPGSLAVLFYGSCRWQVDVHDGIVDLHVLVDDEVAALGALSGRLARLLPPNVYYHQIDTPAGIVRAKVAVLSLREFQRACTPARFHSYFWARYAQPMTLLRPRTPAVRAAVLESLVDALATLFARVLPRLPRRVTPADAWLRALALCYAAELRPESGGGRAATLLDAARSHFEGVARITLLGLGARLEAADVLVLPAPASLLSQTAALAWGWRIVVGKPISLARLIKALYTFDGGLDYIAWKLERHSGQRVEVPDAVRRRPLIHLWPLIWQLYRRGVFR